MEVAVLWTTSIASLLGVWLNIRQQVACFWIWTGTNAVWVYADVKHGILPQAALQAVYLLLAVYGIWRWSPRRKKERRR